MSQKDHKQKRLSHSITEVAALLNISGKRVDRPFLLYFDKSAGPLLALIRRPGGKLHQPRVGLDGSIAQCHPLPLFDLKTCFLQRRLAGIEL